jgi:hypothetical protein
MRQDDYWPQLSVVAACSPYFIAAALRLWLHTLKRPAVPLNGRSTQPVRPGTPFNPMHPVILLLACRADELYTISWAATFWPLWLVFGLLALASIAASVLAVGILVSRDPPDPGQRALFFLCYAFLLTVTTAGLTFLVALAQRLDGNGSVSYEMILAPLICGYSLLLLFYLIFTIVLPPLLLNDLNNAALAEEEAEDDTGVGGVIEAVSQQLAPPVLVQQSSTLFRRMGNSAMFERFLPFSAGASIAPHEPSSTTSSAPYPMVDVEEGRGVGGGAGDRSGEGAAQAMAGSASDMASAAAASDEYEALEKDIELWVHAAAAAAGAARAQAARAGA